MEMRCASVLLFIQPLKVSIEVFECMSEWHAGKALQATAETQLVN